MVRKSRRLNSNMASEEELAEMERLSANFNPETKASTLFSIIFNHHASRLAPLLLYLTVYRALSSVSGSQATQSLRSMLKRTQPT